MHNQQIKFFMPNEANRTLPLVRQIVRDILYNQFQINIIVESLGMDEKAINENRKIQKFLAEIKNFKNELDEIGCYYRDFKASVCLVDFPAIIDGEEVFLCWRSNENSVNYFHSINGGYQARRPIPEYYFQDNFVRIK